MDRTRRTRLGLAAGLSMALMVMAGPAAAQEPSPQLDPADTGYTVRIGFPAGDRDARASSPPDIWAQHLGLFDAAFGPAGITLVFEPFLGAGPAINEALIGGSLDIAQYADTAGVLGRTAGADTSLVAIDQPTTAAWIAVKEGSDITTVADLAGRRVATIKATFPHRFLLAVLEANGLTPDDIEFNNLSIPDSEAAIESDQLDAIVTLGGNAPRLFARGYRAIASTDELPEAAGIGVLAATNPFLAAHPSFFPVFLAARDAAVAWAVANPDEAYTVLAEALKLTPDQARTLYPALDFPAEITPAVLDRIALTDAFLVGQGIKPEPLDLAAWVSDAAGVVTE